MSGSTTGLTKAFMLNRLSVKNQNKQDIIKIEFTLDKIHVGIYNHNQLVATKFSDFGLSYIDLRPFG